MRRLRWLVPFAAVAALMVLAGPVAATEGDEGTELDHEAEECIEILEGGGEVDECQEAPNPILPATDELIWGISAFAVLLLALWKFALPSVRSMMDTRTERIRTSIEEAETAKSDAEGVLTEYRAQLAEARTEAARIIEESRQQADQVRRDLVARAEAEAADLRQRNAEQVAAERDRVMAEVRGQVANLAVELAEKVVEANLDREANMRLIENYINTVGADGGARSR